MRTFPSSKNAVSGRPGRGGEFTELVLVTHEFPPFRGGMATYAADIARVVRAAGCEVKVFAPRYGEPAPALPYNVTRILRHHTLTPSTATELLARSLALPPKVFCHAVDIRSALVLFAAHRFTGRPYGVTIHGSEVAKLGGRSRRAAISRAAYREAAYIFSNSQATANIFTPLVPHDRLRVTPLGVRADWFTPPPPAFGDPRLEQFLGCGPSICTVGRLEPRKGHDRVLEALTRLKAEGADLGYVISGPVIDADYRAALERTIKEADLRVLFVQGADEGDLRRLYANSLCHVLCAKTLPGKIEGFGLVLLEAAAQACPSVATRVGGMPEVVRDGETGLLVEDGNPDQLTAALRQFTEDRTGRDLMGARARERARDFTWEACALATYNGILRGFEG